MKTVSLSGSLRENVGKKDAKTLRYAGKVPCVLYGGEEQVHFQLDQTSFKTILFTPETFTLEIKIGKKTYKTLLKDVQYHPVGDHVLHADFYEIKEDKPVVVLLPVKLIGTSPGIIRGGKLKLKLTRLSVRGLIADMPDFIDINISKLNVGQNIKVKNIDVKNLTMLDNANSVVVEVAAARGIVVTAEEEEEA